ncbi:MAG: DotU family type IV/VI secretion system protein [Desulfobacterales bacterium]|nr:DotU family type IV/VI secretion system protein [Desulfobacterales bacterium]
MRLSDCFMEIIAYTALIVRREGGPASGYDQVRANLERLVTQSEARLEQGRFSREDFDLARFAVFAWVDETILASQWEGRVQWQREQLQRQYYQTADAGELFFERLNTIGPHQRDVREVYYFSEAYPRGDIEPVGRLKGRGRFSAFTLLAAVLPPVFGVVLFFVYKFILSNIGANLMGSVQ